MSSGYPAPVGGLVLSSDLAPSIVFAVLYALLLPLVVYRLYDRRSRTLLLIGTVIFAVERIVIFSLRGAQSRNPDMALSNGLLKYMQVSFGLGFVGIANDMVGLVRCLLVNPTFGPTRWEESPSSRTKESCFEPPSENDEDRPRERFWVRRFADFAGWAFLASSVPGGVSNGRYSKDDFGDAKKADRLFNLRYVSTGVGLFLIVILLGAAIWSRRNQRRPGIKAINTVCALCFLTATVAVYRLSVMFHRIPTIDYRGPGSLTSPGSKASFYVLNVLPEWIAIALLLGLNPRKTFGAGPFGDWRGVDDGPKDIARREKRKAKREAKKAAKLAGKQDMGIITKAV